MYEKVEARGKYQINYLAKLYLLLYFFIFIAWFSLCSRSLYVIP